MADAREVLALAPSTTALVLIDLQRGIVARDTKPHAATDVVARAARLAACFRSAGALVVLVHVDYASDGGDILKTPTDSRVAMVRAADWAELVPEVGPRERDVVVTKRQWGAFYGTELDLQLRRRGITTIVLGGIATNFGVESTARDAWERSYAVVFAEDAMAGITAEAHEFAVTTIFPRLGRVRTSDEIVDALASNT